MAKALRGARNYRRTHTSKVFMVSDRRSSLLLLALLALGACRPVASRADVDPAASATAMLPATATATAATNPMSAPRPVASNTIPLAAGTCRTNADCPSDHGCVFSEAGCTTQAKCVRGGVRLHNCNAAIPMCACSDRHTFYGPGGCAGAAAEPWELYACACKVDSDCGGGQRCVPTGGRPHRPDTSRECRPANDVR